MADGGPRFDEQRLRELLERGARLLREGRFAESASACREALELSPGSADAQLALGTALARMENWDAAVAAFEAALIEAPGFDRVHEQLGDVLVPQEDWRKAARNYAQAIQEHPDRPELRIKLGDVIRQSGDDEQAADLYRQAADLGWNRDEGTASSSGSELYLDLMKRCLTFLLWDAKDGPMLELQIRRPVESLAHLARRLAGRIRPPSSSAREFGLDWPAMALTMIGRPRLDNVQRCVEAVLRDGVPGDLIEAGVWRGGVPIFMRAILKAHAVTDRVVWVADSFRGLPSPDLDRYPADRGFDLSVWNSLAVSLDEVRANFARFRLLDEQVRFLEGWFKDTLPDAPIGKLAVMRLDGDLYESTMDGLVHLHPRLSTGGYAIIDDYQSAPPCRKAVDDYRAKHGIEDEIVPIDWSGAYWRRS
jgi:O-methyltransferase